MHTKKILVVGAGPTGLTAALTLALHGLSVRIIDKATGPITTSNALAVQSATMEVWEELGLIEKALEKGHQLRAANLATSHRQLGRIELDQLPTPYPFVLGLPQHITEQLLTERIRKYGIEVEWEHVLETIEIKGDKADATINGAVSTFDWVIGCDGAHSTVRESLGIGFPGEDLPQHFIMADLTLEWDRPHDELHAFIADEGVLAFIPLSNQGFGRLICDVTADARLKDEIHPTLSDFQTLFDQHCPVPGQLRDATWTSGFWIHSRIADRYRSGPVFIAGDAAHQHSPVGVQGMNTGIQDAYFLCTRIPEVAKGSQPASILDEYEVERRPIGEAVVKATTRATRLLTTQSAVLKGIRNTGIRPAMRVPSARHRIGVAISEL